MPPQTYGAEVHTVETAWSWYLAQKRVWVQVRAGVMDAIANGTRMPFDEFLGLTEEEFTLRFSGIMVELAHLSCMGILSATEGELRRDYLLRVARRDKSEIGRRFRSAYKDREARIALEDGILHSLLVERPGLKSTLSRFKGALRYRHWLAHGRYWNPKLGQRYVPEDVFEICVPLVEAIKR